MKKSWCFLWIALAACASSTKPATSSGSESTESDEEAPANPQVSADAIEEIDNTLRKKTSVVSKCLESAIDAGEVKKPITATVMLTVVVAKTGMASRVRVASSQISSETFKSCVIEKANQWQYTSAIPEPVEASFAYNLKFYE